MLPPNFFRKYLYVLKDKRRQLFLMAALFLLSSILELLGIGLIGPFVGAVVNPALLDRFTSLNSILSYFGFEGARDRTIALGVFLLVVFIIKGAVAYGIFRHISAFTFYFRASLVQRLMSAYLRMPYQFYLERNSAAIVNSVIAHTKTMTDDMLLPSLKLASDAIVLLAIGLFLFWVNPIAMLILLVSLGSTSAFYSVLVKPKVKAAGQEVAVQNEGLIRGVNQGIGGIKEIRILGAEQYFLEHVQRTSTLCADSQKKFYSLIGIPRFLIETVFVIFVVLFALFSLYSGNSGEAMVATLAMFGVAGIRVLPAVANVSSSVASMNYSSYALSELYRDLQEVEQQSKNLSAQAVQSSQFVNDFQQLCLDEICYAYPGVSRLAIDGISLTITQGQSIGLIGESGAGKTTLVDILLGLHQFDSGKFSVNGIDIEEYGWGSWLKQVAYIPQNVFLTDETLAKNIAFGIDDNEIDFARVTEAVSSAQLTELVGRLPGGVQTMVGERGIRLSGGERQRVALARAFYHNRSIFIFDEATSALDAETERQVIEVIEKLHGQKTLIVIAHRLTTIKSCDVIYRLKDGRIIDSGRFEDVVGQKHV